MALEIKDERNGSRCVLVLGGRLDTDTAADLELSMQDLLNEGVLDFVVDLAGVGYVSSAGLRVLLMLGKSIDGKGSLRLSGLNPTVKQVFDVAGFTQLFAIFANRAAAEASIKGRTANVPPPPPKPARPPSVPTPMPEAMPPAPTGGMPARVARALGVPSQSVPVAATLPRERVERIAAALRLR